MRDCWIRIIAPLLREWIEFALSAPVVLWAAAPFFVRGWKGAVTGHANMFTLIGLGVGVAFGYSVVALLFPGIVPSAITACMARRRSISRRRR